MSSSGGGWSDGPVAHVPKVEVAPEEARYREEGLLGRGGMGEVLQAWDARLERRVALKRGQGAPDDPSTARLQREARVTARLDHPGIVPVLDMGRTADGQLFYTMRLIRGRTLLDASSDLPRTTRLRHLLDAVQAVAYAHDRGIVHRDLKPANIMVGPFGETQVVDWGLARVLGEEDIRGGQSGDTVGLTRIGEVLGTPGYLSPEARRGEVVGPPADVYALGCCLVELLTGARQDDWREAASELPEGELRVIALKALALDPQARYTDASGLAKDLSAWLDGRPVDGYRYSFWEVLGRFVQQYRAPLTAGGLATVVGLIGLTVAGVQVLQERDRALLAERRETEARRVADQRLGETLADQAVRAVEDGARVRAMELATQASGLAASPRARGAAMAFGALPRLPIDTVEVPCDGEVRVGRNGWLCTTRERIQGADGRTLHEGAWSAVAPRPGGAYVVSDVLLMERPGSQVSWAPGVLRVEGNRVATVTHVEVVLGWGTALHRLNPCGTESTVRTGAWDGDVFWTLCERSSRLVGTTVEGRAHHAVDLPALGGSVFTMAVREGRLYRGGQDGRLFVHDVQTGEILQETDFGIGRIWHMDASPDGRYLRITGREDEPLLLDAKTLETVVRLPKRWADARFQENGELWSGGEDLQVLDPRRVPRIWHAGAGVSSIDVFGDAVAAATGDGRVVVWDRASRGMVLEERVSTDAVAKSVVFSGDGASLWVSPMLLPLARFDTVTWAPAPYDGPLKACRRLGALADTVWCLTYGPSRPVEVLAGERAVQATGYDLGQSTSDRFVWSDQEDALWMQDGSGVRKVAVLAGVSHVGVDAAGDAVVAVAEDQVVVLDGKGVERARWPIEPKAQDVGLSADGRLVAVGGLDGRVHVWSDDGELLAVLEGLHDERVIAVEFVDGAVVTASWDGRVHLWDDGPLREALRSR